MRISVAITSEERMTLEGALAALRRYKGIDIKADPLSADVLLMFARSVSEDTFAHIEKCRIKNQKLRTIIVADTIPERLLLRAAELDTLSYLCRPETTFLEIFETITSAQTESAKLPPSKLPRISSPTGGDHGLDSRDIAVLTHLSEGADTWQIAQKLNYSDRTIKSIIHEILKNLGVNNRTAAVAYAMRAGLLQ
ncbi:response regulator transcription factor [Streptomyces sp. NPDC059215]|uniref:helix-turn-helix transcriptional regulator n=1 Tax=Streptomyces sp. NPDC059215 TaxID=3346772 RepID=UPI003684ABDE